MSDHFSAISLFVEDIRDEVAGTHSIIGIMPDNISVPDAPVTLPKIGIYTRILLHPDFDPQPIEIVLAKDENEQSLTTIGVELSEQTLRESREAGSNICGLISKMVVAPFQVRTAGRVRVLARTPRFEVESGTLNVVVNPSPTVSQPPSEQSPPDVPAS